MPADPSRDPAARPHRGATPAIARLLACLALLAALIGCGGDAAGPPTHSGNGKPGLTYVNAAAHNEFDPQRMSWSQDIRFARGLYRPLIVLDYDTMTLGPGVAESWDTSDDRLTYTFTLREDAKWSDGSPLTAPDFVYAWRRAMMPDHAAQYFELFECIEGAQAFFDFRANQLAEFARVSGGASAQGGDAAQDAAQAMLRLAYDQFDALVGVEAVDDQTLRVTLNEPTEYFPALASFITFVPNHRPSVEAATTLDATTGMVRVDPAYWSDPNRLVTNGPYKLAERRHRESTLMTAQPHYWAADQVANGFVRELIASDAQSALLAYQSGDADIWIGVPSTAPVAADLVASGRPDVHAIPIAGTYFYNYNCSPQLPDGRSNPFLDPRVRNAFSLAVDRQRLVQQITKLNQPIATTFIPPGSMAGYASPTDGVIFDPDAARALLAEAGHANGSGLDGLSILYNTGQGHEFIAQAIQGMWQRELNVEVSLEGLDSKAFSTRLRNHQFSITRASWIGDYPDPTTFLDKNRTGAGNNDAAYANPEYDALLDLAATQAGAERLATLTDAEALLIADQPMLLLYQYMFIHLWDPQRIQNASLNAWGRWHFEKIVVND
ncbi:MAG: peptide ABC transporter substrate-binding protein [Planctomycetota bacterium]